MAGHDHATPGHGAEDVHAATHAHDAAPEPAPETAEEREDRERSASVERAITRAVARPLGPLLLIAGAGVSLALLSKLGPAAEPLAWLWLLPALLATAWGLALIRQARAAA